MTDHWYGSTHSGGVSYICIAFVISGRVARGREEKPRVGCQSKLHRGDPCGVVGADNDDAGLLHRIIEEAGCLSRSGPG